MSSTSWIDLLDCAEAEVISCVDVFAQPHDVFWRHGEINGRKKKKKSYKAVQHIDSVIFRCGSYVHAFVLVLVFAVF